LLLDKFTDLQILLFGPYYVLPPKHSRLIVFGQVEHKYIFKIMECSDAMIMPFLVNDLIKSVNPVKLYEYIYSCKPCISVYYEEVVKFKEFTYLYNNQRELVEMVGKLIIGKLQPKSNKTEISKFCIENTWEKRTEAIFNIIELNS